MRTVTNYLKTHVIEAVLILVLAIVAIRPSVQAAQPPSATNPPSNIAPLSYTYPWTWSNRVAVRTAVEHCSNSWFRSSWYSGDRPIIKNMGSGAYTITYQKGIWVEVQKGSGSTFDIIYFRSTGQPGYWELKPFQYTDPMLRQMAESRIEDIEGVVYAQAYVTRNGDEQIVDLYCFPGK